MRVMVSTTTVTPFRTSLLIIFCFLPEAEQYMKKYHGVTSKFPGSGIERHLKISICFIVFFKGS